MGKIRDFFAHAFAVEKEADFVPDEEQTEVIDKIAEKIVKLGLTTPAIMFLESVKPMNYIGSQTMAFFEPIVRGLFDWRGYGVFQGILEHRGSIPIILDRIEYYESNLHTADKEQAKHSENKTK